MPTGRARAFCSTCISPTRTGAHPAGRTSISSRSWTLWSRSATTSTSVSSCCQPWRTHSPGDVMRSSSTATPSALFACYARSRSWSAPVLPLAGRADMATTGHIPLGLSTFVLASPFSDADLALFGKVKSFGYEQVEVCIEDPSRLTAPAVAKAAADAGLSVLVCGAFGPDRDVSNPDEERRRGGIGYLGAWG